MRLAGIVLTLMMAVSLGACGMANHEAVRHIQIPMKTNDGAVWLEHDEIGFSSAAIRWNCKQAERYAAAFVDRIGSSVDLDNAEILHRIAQEGIVDGKEVLIGPGASDQYGILSDVGRFVRGDGSNVICKAGSLALYLLYASFLRRYGDSSVTKAASLVGLGNTVDQNGTILYQEHFARDGVVWISADWRNHGLVTKAGMFARKFGGRWYLIGAGIVNS